MGNCLKREIGFEVEEDQNDTADVEEIIKKIKVMKNALMYQPQPTVNYIKNEESFEEQIKKIDSFSMNKIEDLENSNNLTVSFILSRKSHFDLDGSILAELSINESKIISDCK